MSIPTFSRVFQVTIQKHGSERQDETLKVLADGIEEAILLGYAYVEFLDEDDVVCYEVTSAQLWYDIFTGVEDDTEEVELVPAHPPYNVDDVSTWEPWQRSRDPFGSGEERSI